MSTTFSAATRPPYTWTVRVYYEDTDTGGVVYYANYLKFFERARTEWLRSAGFEQRRLAEEIDLQFVVVQVQCDYLRAARLDDVLEIDVRVTDLRRVSVAFEQTARRGTEVLATARVRAACIHARRFAPMAMPAEMQAAFATLTQDSSALPANPPSR